MKRFSVLDYRAAIAANLLVFSVAIYAWAILSLDENLYYLTVQEDEYLEWMSFWAFFAAGVIYVRRALRHGFVLSADWFTLGLAAFCLFVAFEEISWGQRIFSYRPPEYFLSENFQQELNLHNLVDTGLRKLAVRVVIFDYGVALPMLMLVPPVGRLAGRLGVVSPSPALMPAFLATGVMQVTYPLKFTGEWIELMLGLCFLFAALAAMRRTDASTETDLRLPAIALAALSVMALGVVSSAVTSFQRDRDPGNVKAAYLELEALKRDFESGRGRNRCGVHKRLYTFVEQYGQRRLLSGDFAQLVAQGLPEQRASYLLDPWNYAYWIRDNCASGERERVTFLYSFGPNQRRESTKWEVRGDDVAVFIRGGDAPEPKRP
ncbi:MAG: hypothetical protein KJO76_06230 [Gammaproteobacteria bacterium]|nr:hypothetical protein [Gammaproteobacteria bacterium]MBT8445031.1 hypothetical protein [Gammaproteobacteria bacterium]NND37915.1 hypothetical protein [Gammaproteobacteria bacterium]